MPQVFQEWLKILGLPPIVLGALFFAGRFLWGLISKQGVELSKDAAINTVYEKLREELDRVYTIHTEMTAKYMEALNGQGHLMEEMIKMRAEMARLTETNTTVIKRNEELMEELRKYQLQEKR